MSAQVVPLRFAQGWIEDQLVTSPLAQPVWAVPAQLPAAVAQAEPHQTARYLKALVRVVMYQLRRDART